MNAPTRTCRICGQEHRVGIGGSTMAAILGLSNWKNALDAYHGLTRPDELYSDEEPESIDLFRGNALEAQIGEWYGEETGDVVEPWGGWVEHPDFPAFVGHPDFRILDGAGETVGVLEVKAPRSSVFQRVYEQGLRQSEIVQLATYIAIAGLDRGAFAYGNLEHDAGPVLPVQPEYDPKLGAFLLEVGQRFWDEHVVPRVPPDPDDWRLIEDPDAPTIVETTGERIEVDDPELVDAATRALEAKDLEARGEELCDKAKAEIAAIMKRLGTDRVDVPGVARLTIVRNAGRSTFSESALRGHRPIDRDKLWKWMRENGPDAFARGHDEELDAWLDDLALDVDQFKRQGAPYSYVLPTDKRGK